VRAIARRGKAAGAAASDGSTTACNRRAISASGRAPTIRSTSRPSFSSSRVGMPRRIVAALALAVLAAAGAARDGCDEERSG